MHAFAKVQAKSSIEYDNEICFWIKAKFILSNIFLITKLIYEKHFYGNAALTAFPFGGVVDGLLVLWYRTTVYGTCKNILNYKKCTFWHSIDKFRANKNTS